MASADDYQKDAPLRACPACRQLTRTFKNACPECGARLLTARPVPPDARAPGAWRGRGGGRALPRWLAPFAGAPVTAGVAAFLLALFAASVALAPQSWRGLSCMMSFAAAERARQETGQPEDAARWAPAMRLLGLPAPGQSPWSLKGPPGGGMAEKSVSDAFLSGSPGSVFLLGGGFGPAMAGGQWWRLLTACFLHFGVLHIVMNGLALRDLGSLAESLWGRRRLWVAFVATGAAGNLLSLFWHGFLGHHNAGASGAICGLLGLLLGAWRRGRGLPDQLGRLLVRWAVTLAVFGLIVEGIDNAAHLGGGLAGFAFGWFALPRAGARPGSAADHAWTAAAAVAALLAAGAFAMCAVWNMGV